MAMLIGSHLRVDLLLGAETGLRSPQHLKVHTPEYDVLELPLDVPRRKLSRDKNVLRSDGNP
jgi:hypothetical protein